MIYAAYYISRDGVKTRIECSSTAEYKPGDIIKQWDGSTIEIDFKWTPGVYKLNKIKGKE